MERHEPVGEIVLYQTPDGHARVECRFADETLWLSQALIAELFEKNVRTINEHLQNLLAEGKPERAATIRRLRIVCQEGARQVAREIEHYNRDAILAVGYFIPMVYFTWSMRYGKIAPANPWPATGLEWQTASPPPTENFAVTPTVTEEVFDYSKPPKEPVFV